MPSRGATSARVTLTTLSGILALAGSAEAHVGALRGSGEAGTVPLWLTVLTGGGIVAASFLFTAFITDRRDIAAIAGLGVHARIPTSVWGIARRVGGVLGVGALLTVIAIGLFGPTNPLRNFAILLVWAGWWAGYTMSVYLVGNSWPLVNPWRRIADLLPTQEREYPDWLGVWPAVVGLLGLVVLEVVSPLATDPRLLAMIVVLYSVVTIGGAVLVGPSTWFRNVDPVARVFRLYGRLAPVGRETLTDGNVRGPPNDTDRRRVLIGWPGVRLCRPDEALDRDETAFVVALLWATTFDGLVSTPLWAGIARTLVPLGVPAPALYIGGMVVGFGLFLGIYGLAARYARTTADTYVTAEYLGGWFALALLPIAAGYHLAHFLGYLLRLTPALGETLLNPLSPPTTVTVIVLPEWFGVVELGFVVGGHLLAVWIAHSSAFRLFPGALTPLRSQYPFVLAMVGYTVVSMWIVAQPFVPPPFV